MSLWHKTISEINFSDIDAFCQSMQPENARLDYKGVKFPSDLAKTIAAFANTIGGLIILGVVADKNTNTPIWPATEGLPSSPGIQERIYQTAQEAITPPVGIAVSSPIDNPNLPGHVIVVIRVNESPLAPHATAKNRHVYIYERSENRNEPFELANIDRIEYLLHRRGATSAARENALTANFERGARNMHAMGSPVRWMAVSPIFPWRDVHDKQFCARQLKTCQFTHRAFPRAHWNYQHFEAGGFAMARAKIAEGASPACVAIASLSSNGMLFCMAYADEAIDKDEDCWINTGNTRIFFTAIGDDIKEIYSKSSNPPGAIILSAGFSNAFGVQMHDDKLRLKSRYPYVDQDFRSNIVIDFESFQSDQVNPVDALLTDIIFAFDAHATSY